MMLASPSMWQNFTTRWQFVKTLNLLEVQELPKFWATTKFQLPFDRYNVLIGTVKCSDFFLRGLD